MKNRMKPIINRDNREIIINIIKIEFVITGYPGPSVVIFGKTLNNAKKKGTKNVPIIIIKPNIKYVLNRNLSAEFIGNFSFDFISFGITRENSGISGENSRDFQSSFCVSISIKDIFSPKRGQKCSSPLYVSSEVNPIL